MSIWNKAGPQGGTCFRPAGLSVTIIKVGMGKGVLQYITSLLKYLLWLEADRALGRFGTAPITRQAFVCQCHAVSTPGIEASTSFSCPSGGIDCLSVINSNKYQCLD